MKKALFATTALVAAGIAGSASAAEWNAGVNGYMQIGLGLTENVGVGVLRDGEIHFNAKLAADNGITFAARVELEATTQAANGDTIDENYATVSGSFGSIKVGGDDGASNAYSNGVIYAPGARVGYYDAFGLAVGNQMGGVADITNDAPGIHYDSPNFNGFQVGASYVPNTGADNRADSGVVVNEADNGWAVGAVYSGDFDGFGFGIGAGYGDVDGPNNDHWHVGGNISAAGFKVAAQYEDDGTDEMAVGATFGSGPITVGAGFATDFVAGENPTVFAGWLSYAVAPGVSATVGAEAHNAAGQDTELAGLAYLQMGF